MSQTVSTSGDLDRLNLDEIRRFLERRWKLAGAIAAACLLLAVVACLAVRPSYTATAQVLLDPHRPHAFGQDTVQPDSLLDSSIVDSQISIITSTRLLAKVINKENLAADPEFAASTKTGLLGSLFALFHVAAAKEPTQPSLDGIDPKLEPVIINLFNKIEVARIAKSYVLSLSVSSRDPAKATRLANALAETFVEDRVDVHAKSVGQAAAFFEDRLGSLRDQVRQSERAVADFRKTHDLTTTTMDGKITVSELQLQHLNEQLALAATDTAEKLARFQQAARFTAAGTNTDTLPEIIRSPAIVQLRGQQADLMRRESDLSALYGPAYPAITQIRAQKAGLDHAIGNEVKRLVASLRNDYEVAAAREKALRKTIAGLSDVSGGDNDVGVKLRELERTNQANQALFENFLNRAKLTQEQSSFEEPDARLISPALEPTAPSFPKIKLIVPVAGVAGVILGLGVAAAADLLPASRGGAVSARPAAFILGRVPDVERSFASAEQLSRLLARDPRSRYARSVEALAMKLVGPEESGPGRAIALAPLEPDEHVTDLAIALALVLGGKGLRVLLVDVDHERRALSRAFGAQAAPGLAELVAGDLDAKGAVIRQRDFTVLPAGVTAVDNLSVRQMRSFLKDARGRYDLILFETPSLVADTTALALSATLDGLAIVACWDGLTQDDFVMAVDAAAETRNFMGVVLTGTEAAAEQDYALAS